MLKASVDKSIVAYHLWGSGCMACTPPSYALQAQSSCTSLINTVASGDSPSIHRSRRASSHGGLARNLSREGPAAAYRGSILRARGLSSWQAPSCFCEGNARNIFAVNATDSPNSSKDSGSNDGEEESRVLMTIGRLPISKQDLRIMAVAAIVVAFSVANRVLYKMALVPMKDYPFFLALFNTVGYVMVYFSTLYLRYRAGIVTDEMLTLPKSYFIIVGLLEALGVASGMAAAAVLPGAAIPILIQTFLVWQLALSTIFLKKRYSFSQIIGCIMVLAGVVLALTSTGSGLTFSPDQTGVFWPFLMVISAAFQASASIIKEFIFRNASKHLQGGSVDIFVVNSFGSGFQAIFVFVLLPLLSQLRGIPFSQLPAYVRDGAGCLFNVGSKSLVCNGATLLTFSYITVNLAFNISLLTLLKMSSAVVSSLCTTIAVPLSIYMFTLPLPYVGTPAPLPPQFLLGTAVLVSGLGFYNLAGRMKFAKHD